MLEGVGSSHMGNIFLKVMLLQMKEKKKIEF